VKNAPSGAGWHALGLAHLKLKKPEKAQADFEAALKVAPQHLSSAVELAQLALGRKEPASVLKALEPALAETKALSPPERSRALAVKGAALLLQSRPADAQAGLEEAVRLDPNNVFAKGTLARTYAALKQDEKALPLWKAAVAGEPDNPLWADGQVQSLATLKKPEEALAAATKARAAFPKDEPTALIVARAQELRMPFAPLLTVDEVLASEHLAERGFFVEVEQPGLGAVTLPGPPVRMSETSMTVGPAPALAEHLEAVLSEGLGFEPEEIAFLRRQGIV